MAFVRTQIAERKADIKSGGAAGTDVFSMLIEASEKEDAKLKLDDSELVRIGVNLLCTL